jgi:Family of unknown function (DUF6174)
MIGASKEHMSPLSRVLASFAMAWLVACTPPAGGPVEDLASARELWEASGPASYQFEIDGGGCECTLAGRYRITVTEGLVSGVIRLDLEAEHAMSSEIGATIDDLFDMIDEGLSGAEEVEATYDTELGFPTAFRIVWNRRVDDGTFFATINLVNSAGP